MFDDPKDRMGRFLYERHCATVQQLTRKLEADLPSLVPGIKAEDYLRLLNAVREQTEDVPEYKPETRWGLP